MVPTHALSRLAVRATALLTLGAAPAAAQPAVSASVATAIDSIAPAGVSSETTAAPLISAAFEHLFADERGRLFYELDAGTFGTPGDWHYQVHNAGGSWTLASEDGRRRLYVGGSAWWRANGDSWAAANYRGVGAFSNVEWRLRPTAVVRIGYRFDTRQFPDLAELDQQQHTGFASLLVNLPSRTTVIGEAHLGAKSYQGGVTYVESVPSADPATVVTPPVATRGRGPGLSASLRTVLPSWSEVASPDSAARQLTLFGRVAQSVADRTSLSVQASRRTTSGGLPPALVATPELFFDDGVYDDPFASEATDWRISVKHVAARGALLEAGGGRVLKDYTGTPALDLDGVAFSGAPLRADRVWRGDARLAWPLFGNRTGPVALGASLGYLFTKHESNSAFYNYTSHRLSVGLTLEY